MYDRDDVFACVCMPHACALATKGGLELRARARERFNANAPATSSAASARARRCTSDQNAAASSCIHPRVFEH
jgi:hypothetical protein